MTGTALAVTSGKGGVGKSTTALNLGVALLAEGHSVALVDADLGMANLGTMVGIESDHTLHDVLAGEADVEEATVTEGESFAVVPGDRDLGGYAAADPAGLPGVLADLAERYEFVVVDAGAGLGYADVVPIEAADEVVLVTTPADTAVGDTAKLAEFSGLVDGALRGVVVTRAGNDTDGEAIAAEIGTELLAVVPEDPAVPESAAAGQSLERHAPDSTAAAAYRRLARVLAGDDGAEDATEDDGGGEDAETDDGGDDDAPPDDGESVEALDDRGEATAAPDENEPRDEEDGPGESVESGPDDGATAEDAESGASGETGDESGDTETTDETDGSDGDGGDGGDGDDDDRGASDDIEGDSGGLLSRLRGLF